MKKSNLRKYNLTTKRSLSRRKFINHSVLTLFGTMSAKTLLGSYSFKPDGRKAKTGMVKGIVLGGSNIAIPNTTVRIINTYTKEARMINAPWPGTFEFKDLPPGKYEVTVPSMSGFDPVNVDLQSGAITDVTLRIKPTKISSSFLKPSPKTMAELSSIATTGVSVVEVSDYIFGGYQGELTFPPNADGNPRKAFIVFWKNFSHRFVFAHEGSYCPWMEVPSGAAVCYQFFEGNIGRAELFNTPGRRERNTFVEVIEPGPGRVWVRWTYFGVNQETGEPYYRGTEDFWTYPIGLILRRQTFSSLRSDVDGYSREPIENIGMCPVGKTWVDVLRKDPVSGEHHALAVLDVFSENRYDVFWKHIEGTLNKANPRRSGANWRELDDSAGVVFTIPMKGGSPFCVFGDASGFRHDFTRIKEHSHVDTGGIGWVGQSWDHWPIGWLNSQGHEVDEISLKKYPNHFSPAGMDFFALENEEAEKGIYYSLMGVGGEDLERIRKVANAWLKKGETIIAADMNSGADLVFSL